LAEVLTVIGQHAVAILAHTGTCPADYFIGIEARRVLVPDPERASVGELLQTHLLDRASMQTSYQTTVLDDLAVAHIDTVMGIASTRCNDVCTRLE
jgi:hypothetical protein